jgi:hypothetical protein
MRAIEIGPTLQSVREKCVDNRYQPSVVVYKLV